jgi:energy-coupling factor transport system substrate-specific component
MENNLNNKQGWALRDVIMMALLGLVFAAVYPAVFNVGMALAAALTTTGLGDFAFDVIYGVWFMAGTLGAYIIRKKGAGLISELLASIMELLYGNAGGITVVITGLIQGLGTELGFACFKWKKWGFLSLSVAGVLSGIFIYIYELFYLQYYMLDPMMHVGHLVIRSISAIIFSGILCKLIGDGLAKTGVMKNYAIGRTLKSSGVYEDEE